jgi:hypothetical protein
MNLTVFGVKPTDSIFLPQMPFAVRNDCQIGQWKVGDADFRGNSIDISIIKVSQFFGSLGKTKNAQWIQIWFIPAPSEEKLPSSTVCITYIKSRSISQFSQKITELMASGEPGLGIFTASFEKHSGDLGTYYSLQWGWRTRANEAENTQIEQIATFMQTSPVLFDMNNAANLICIDGMSNEEISMLINSAHAETEEPQVQPKNGKLARK